MWKIWNWDFLEMVAPPLVFATNGCLYLTNIISPNINIKSRPYMSVIYIWEKHNNPDLPTYLKTIYILNCGLFDFCCWSPFGLFTPFGTYFCAIRLKWHILIYQSALRLGRGGKLCFEVPTETPRYLHNTKQTSNNLL